MSRRYGRASIVLALLALGILAGLKTAEAQVDTIPVPRAVAEGGVQISVLVDGDTVSTHAQLHVAVSELVAHKIRCPACTVTIEQTQRYRADVIWFYRERLLPEPEPEPEPPADSVPDPIVDPEPEPVLPPTIAASPQIAWGSPYPVDGPYPLLALWGAVDGVDGYRVTYGPQGAQIDTEEPHFQAPVAVEVGWLCVRTYWTDGAGEPDALSTQRCNSYPSAEPHNQLEYIYNSAADSLTLRVGEEDKYVVVRWWNARPTVPVVLPSGERGWLEVERIMAVEPGIEAHALRTVPGGSWRPDPGAIIYLTPEDPDVATVNDILYHLTEDPALGPVVVVRWEVVTDPELAEGRSAQE